MSFTPTTGRYLLSYSRTATQIASVPHETNGDEEQLIYGEIINVISVNAEQTELTLDAPLAREYDIVGTYLRCYPLHDIVTLDLTIEDVEIDGAPHLAPWPGACIAPAYTDGLTIRNVTIRHFKNQGIRPLWSRRVVIDHCRLEDIYGDLRLTGHGYAIQPQFCTDVTVTTCAVRNARYALSIIGGTDHAVKDLAGERLFNTGVTADIHGGDALRVEFNQVQAAYSGIRVGNQGWQRGADQVVIKDCFSFLLALVSSARNITVENWAGHQIGFNATAGDDGGVPAAMNSTGADFGGVLTATFDKCTADYVDSPHYPFSRKVALQIFTTPTTGANKFEGVTFNDCILQVNFDGSGNIYPAVICDGGSFNPTCDIAFVGGELNTLQTYTGTNRASLAIQKPGNVKATCSGVLFRKTSSSQQMSIAGDNSSSADLVELKCCEVTYPGTAPFLITTSNYTTHVYGVPYPAQLSIDNSSC